VAIAAQYRPVHHLEGGYELQAHVLRGDRLMLPPSDGGVGGHHHHQLVPVVLGLLEVPQMAWVQYVEHSAGHHPGHFPLPLLFQNSIMSFPSRKQRSKRSAYLLAFSLLRAFPSSPIISQMVALGVTPANTIM